MVIIEDQLEQLCLDWFREGGCQAVCENQQLDARAGMEYT